MRRTAQLAPPATDLRRFPAIVTVLALVVAFLPGGAGSADAQEGPTVRGIDTACPPAVQQLRPYPGGTSPTHAAAIACLTYYRIAEGRVRDGIREFGSSEVVTRGQMASFLTRMVEFVTEEEIPLTIGYEDDAGEHQVNIRKMATLEVARGFEDRTFRPDDLVTRQQMATFITRAIEVILREQLPEADFFDDVADVHAASVGKLGALGVVVGREDGTFGGREPVDRAQMASFLARALDVVADRGIFPDLMRPAAGIPSVDLIRRSGTAGSMGVAAVRTEAHPWFDRIVFAVEGAGTPGYQAEYVRQARAPSGTQVIDVSGTTILRVAITEVGDPDGVTIHNRARLPGPDGGDITEVVNGGLVDGQHVFFVGTDTGGRAPIVVRRYEDPTVVVLDIFRGFDEPPLPTPSREVVSSFTTPLTPGQARNTNIHLAADYIDGDVIPVGGTYSLSRGIGPRTTARGFVPNGFISGGELISAIGGGVSQMGTTFVNAAWESGIQIDQFRPHSIYFTRYPMCREATLSGTVLDVVVTNDSPHDVTIRTSYSQSQVTVSFVSVPWASVSSWTGSPRNVVGGVGGAFSVSCGRTVTYPDGSSRSESFSWRYNGGYPG